MPASVAVMLALVLGQAAVQDPRTPCPASASMAALMPLGPGPICIHWVSLVPSARGRPG